MPLPRSGAAVDRPADLHVEFAAAWERLEIHGHDIRSPIDGGMYAIEALP